jgi:hypothetical protein
MNYLEKIAQDAFNDELQKIALSRRTILGSLWNRISGVTYSRAGKEISKHNPVIIRDKNLKEIYDRQKEAMNFAENIPTSHLRDVVKLTQKEFPKNK